MSSLLLWYVIRRRSFWVSAVCWGALQWLALAMGQVDWIGMMGLGLIALGVSYLAGADLREERPALVRLQANLASPVQSLLRLALLLWLLLPGLIGLGLGWWVLNPSWSALWQPVGLVWVAGLAGILVGRRGRAA